MYVCVLIELDQRRLFWLAEMMEEDMKIENEYNERYYIEMNETMITSFTESHTIMHTCTYNVYNSIYYVVKKGMSQVLILHYFSKGLASFEVPELTALLEHRKNEIEQSNMLLLLLVVREGALDNPRI